MTDIRANISEIRQTLPTGVQLLCVSKYHTESDILEAYKAGERSFGESRVQELCQKAAHLPKDIEWHFIGHLQTNKIRTLLPIVTLIHGVDSLHLLEAINAEAAKQQITARVLLEVHIASETTKFGFTPESLRQTFQTLSPSGYPNVKVCGLMGMASFTDDKAQVRREFHQLKELFDNIRAGHFGDSDAFKILSMGMSDDYLIATEEGSNLVRIGTGIFGDRTL